MRPRGRGAPPAPGSARRSFCDSGPTSGWIWGQDIERWPEFSERVVAGRRQRDTRRRTITRSALQ
eukprot:9826388-Alexandrium_andersonii.AAC.1